MKKKKPDPLDEYRMLEEYDKKPLQQLTKVEMENIRSKLMLSEDDFHEKYTKPANDAHEQLQRAQARATLMIKRVFAAAAIILIIFVYWHANGTPALKLARVPRGGRSFITLADSSKVWLNAETVFHYPVTFEGSERIVELEQGEASFEVMRAAQPFIVRCKGLEIQALGTKFNVNAYGDKATVIATLEKGSIRVTHEGRSLLLKPGQEATLSSQGQLQQGQSNLNHVTAWNKGYFGFHNSSLPEIMAEIQRWYDVEAVYPDTLPEQRLVIPPTHRHTSLNELLKLIEDVSCEVHFEVKDKKVFIRKCPGPACQTQHR